LKKKVRESIQDKLKKFEINFFSMDFLSEMEVL
jgi:hypothetical protein